MVDISSSKIQHLIALISLLFITLIFGINKIMINRDLMTIELAHQIKNN